MKTYIRITKREDKVYLQILDLKYKDKIVAEKELSKHDCRWLIAQLAGYIY